MQFKSTRQVVEESNRVGVQFLLADLTAALTFLDVADATGSWDTRNRNLQNARSAYETVLRLLPRVFPSVEERSALQAKLDQLKKRLLALGYCIDPDDTEHPDNC